MGAGFGNPSGGGAPYAEGFGSPSGGGAPFGGGFGDGPAPAVVVGAGELQFAAALAPGVRLLIPGQWPVVGYRAWLTTADSRRVPSSDYLYGGIPGSGELIRADGGGQLLRFPLPALNPGVYGITVQWPSPTYHLELTLPRALVVGTAGRAREIYRHKRRYPAHARWNGLGPRSLRADRLQSGGT